MKKNKPWVATADKHKTRVLQFIEEDALDGARFESILTRHGLLDSWRTFQHQFLE